MQLGTTVVNTGAISPFEPDAARLGSRLSHALQLAWLALQVGVLALALAATPLLFAHLQTVTPNQLGEISLAQPNAATAATLARLGIPLRAYAAVMVAFEWVVMLPWVALGTLIAGRRSRDPVGMALAFMAV